ncbi:MAG: cell division protein FtsQ/DivIB [Clostridia bacterium]
MKKSKGQTVDLLYKTKENSKKPKQTKKRKTKNKNQKANNDIINLDNEIIIGMTLKEEPKKNEKKRTKKTKKTKELTAKKIKKKEQVKRNNKKEHKNKKKNIKLKIIKWVFLLALLVTAIILFMLSSVFNIKSITVTNNKKISEQEIVSLSGLVKDENMFKISNKTIKEAIKQNPYIEDVKITKKLSGEINLEITERIPTYMIRFANGYVYINNQGYMLEISEEPLELPIISGLKTKTEDTKAGNRLVVEDLKELENIIKIMEIAKSTSVGEKITEFDISDTTNYKIIIASEGKTVDFGDLTNINIKILKIEYIIEQEKGKQGEIYFQGTEKVVFREKV